MSTITTGSTAPRRTRRLPGSTAVLLLGLSMVSSPAPAQFFGNNVPGPPGFYGSGPVFRGYQRPVPPDDVVDRLEDNGFEDVSRPRFDGSNYLVDATDPRGRRIRLVVDAFRGAIVDRYAVGRAETDDQRGWFGNNVRPPDGSPAERSARVDPPRPIEIAPLDAPRPLPEAPRPAVRQPAPPRAGQDRAASLPKPVRPAEAAPSGSVDGGNPDALKGEQRRPSAAVVPTPPASPPAATPAAPPVPAPSPVAAVPSEPARPAPKVETLSPVRPLRPQAAPDAAAPLPNERSQTNRTDRPVRVIGGVTPVPGATSEPKAGSVTADSDGVKP